MYIKSFVLGSIQFSNVAFQNVEKLSDLSLFRDKKNQIFHWLPLLFLLVLAFHMVPLPSHLRTMETNHINQYDVQRNQVLQHHK